MVGLAAEKRARVRAFLGNAPASVTVKLAQAAGLFAPISPLIRNSPFDRPDVVRPDTLKALWALIIEELAPASAARALEHSVSLAIGLDADGADTPEAIRLFQREAGRALLAHLNGTRDDDHEALEESFGGREGVRSALLAAALLAVGPEIDQLYDGWPSDSLMLSAARIEDLRSFIGFHEKDVPDVGPAVLCLTIGRLKRREDILKAVDALVRKRDSHRHERTQYCVVIDALFAHAREQAAELATQAFVADPDAQSNKLNTLADRYDALGDALDGRVYRGGRDRIAEARSDVAERCAEACAAFTTAIADALPQPNTPSEKLAPPDHAATTDASALGRFLELSTGSATRLGFESARRSAIAAFHGLASDEAVNRALRDVSSFELGLMATAVAWLGAAITVTRSVDGDAAAEELARRLASAQGRPDARSLFFEPLERVLVSPSAPRRAGEMSRARLDALWAWISEELAPEEAAAALDAINEAIARKNYDVARELTASWRQVTAGLMRMALEDECVGGSQRLMRVLGGEAGVQDAAVAAPVLACAQRLDELFEEWPERLRDLDERRVLDVRRAHDDMIPDAPEIAPLLALMVMRRLARPAHVFRVVERICGHSHDYMVEGTDFAIVGDALLEDAERDAEYFSPGQAADFNADDALPTLERFAILISGMTEEFNIRKEGRWGARLFAVRSRTARWFETICGRALESIEAATRGVAASQDDRSQPPAGDLDIGQVAIEYARFLAGSAVLAERAAFVAVRTRALNAARERVSVYADSLIHFLRSDPGAESGYAMADPELVIQLLATLEGAEAADTFRRRTAAAA